MEEQSQKKISRRDAIKLLGVAAGATVLANLPSKWSKPELTSGVLPAHAQTSPTLPTVVTLYIGTGTNPNYVVFSGNVTDDGGSSVTVRGFVWGDKDIPEPTLSNANNVLDGSGSGIYSAPQVYFPDTGNYYVRAYATNGVGTAYGAVLQFSIPVCMVEGTLITMADGTTKKIEDIEYSDWLSVWNFEERCFDTAQPLWIKVGQTVKQYGLLEFSDGSSLRVINQHRIFNKEEGMFTYTMSEDTPIGTTTFNVHGQEVKLVNTRIVEEEVQYYNIITYRHMNLFSNGILTSIGFNNIYPIVDMKFVMDERALVPQDAYCVEDKYYEGLRLAEQTMPVADAVAYINKLKSYRLEGQDVEAESVFA